MSGADWAVMRQIAAQGYLTVLENDDSDDWARPGVSRILSKLDVRSRTEAAGVAHRLGLAG